MPTHEVTEIEEPPNNTVPTHHIIEIEEPKGLVMRYCESCQEMIGDEKSFKNHVKLCKIYFPFSMTTSEFGVKCKLCLKLISVVGINNSEIIMKHVEEAHSDPSGLGCQICKDKHNDKKELLDHMNSYHITLIFIVKS